MLVPTLVTALVLDFLLGDPQWKGHPVRLVGVLAEKLEPSCRSLPVSASSQGGVFVFLVLLCSLAPVALVMEVAGTLPLGWLLAGGVLYFALGGTSLAREVASVETHLRAGDLEGAKERLGFLVSREVDPMTEEDASAAALETLSENFGDAACATLLYAALGGPVLAWLHRTVNTLDAMVGYRNPKYAEFGRAAAKLDDLLNLLPARAAALALAAASPLVGGSFLPVWEGTRRDAPRDESPNSGWPMAALAYALGVTLGGRNRYFGLWEENPLMGDGPRPVPEDLQRGLTLYWGAYAGASFAALGLGALMSL